ncbi:hypothetical protein [Paenibacillus ginsengarvi]|nr:hypothetical protein [Paenibacillus ginsengarvi]
MKIPLEDKFQNLVWISPEEITLVSESIPGDPTSMAVLHTSNKGILYPLHSEKASRQLAENLGVPFIEEE